MGLGLEIGMLLEETLMKKLLFIYMHLFPHTHSPTQSGCAINVFPASFLKETFIAAVAICRGLIWVVGGWTQNRLRGLGKWARGLGRAGKETLGGQLGMCLETRQFFNN